MKIGKVSESVLKRSVLRQLKTKNENVLCGAGVGDDCAIFALSDTEKLATCVQEGVVLPSTMSPKGKRPQDSLFMQMPEAEHDTKADRDEQAAAVDVTAVTMTQLVQKCVNNLVADGATPFAVMISLLLPETIEEPQIKQLMAEAEKACSGQAVPIQIAGGQTRVSSAVNAPIATITGYGKITGNDYRTAASAKPGQDIVISKWIGLEGTAVLAARNREKLLGRYPAYLVEEAEGFDKYLSIVPEAATAMKSGVCAMHDASEGGIFAALWELAEGAGVGLTIDLKKLPLRQETVEVCECCNVNPYELKSGGSLVMTTEDGLGLVAALEAQGIPAAVVGKLTDSNDRIIINEDETRYMDRPRTDEVYKI